MYLWCESVHTCHIRHAGLFSIRRLCAWSAVLVCCVISSLVITNAALSNSALICCACTNLRVSSRPCYTSLPNINGEYLRPNECKGILGSTFDSKEVHVCRSYCTQTALQMSILCQVRLLAQFHDGIDSSAHRFVL